MGFQITFIADLRLRNLFFLLLSVTDTGQGIPASEIPNLGRKFYRVNNYVRGSKNSNDRIIRPGGTGLGLYVTFALVKAMGGEIDVQSKLGFGSTFSASFQNFTNQKPYTSDGKKEQINAITNS